MNTPEPFNDLSWNDDPLHSPNRTVYIEKLRARVKELEGERETHIMQLAGISTACVQNTERTIKDRITKENPYWTVAYGDVCVAVDREMRERNQVKKQHAKLTALEKERDQLKGEVGVAMKALDELARLGCGSGLGRSEGNWIARRALDAINESRAS